MLFTSSECQNFKIRDEKGEKPDAYFEKLYIHSINCVAQFLQFLVFLCLQVLVEEMLKPEKYRKMNYHISEFRGTYRLRNGKVLSKKSVNQICISKFAVSKLYIQ